MAGSLGLCAVCFLFSVLLQLRAEAALPGEAVGGAPEVRHQGRELARDRASGEVSCDDVIISAFPLLLAEARVYFFSLLLNGKKVLLAIVDCCINASCHSVLRFLGISLPNLSC